MDARGLFVEDNLAYDRRFGNFLAILGK